MELAIVGSGVVGQATGRGLAVHNHNVVFHDIDKKKLLTLSSKGYQTTSDVEEAVQKSDITFVCVPTPTINKKVDVGSLWTAAINIGVGLKKAKNFPVVAFRSTAPPQTTRVQLVPLLENSSGLKAGKDFGVCMNPEFLRENSPLDDFLHPDRIVVGELENKSGDIMEEIYSSFKSPITRTSLDSAEMIKYASNLFLATKISFFNEIHMICQELGVDSKVVSETVSLDKRIGKYGTQGGKPFGGMCFPKDLAGFITFAKSKGINPKLLEAVEEINAQISVYNSVNKGVSHCLVSPLR
jgi:UDPglucose 6-dehydrogenase